MNEQDQQNAIAKAIQWYPMTSFLYDLNEMHRAELSITPGVMNSDEVWLRYVDHLETIAGPGMSIIATAPQRAEAFLRAKGLWKEE